MVMGPGGGGGHFMFMGPRGDQPGKRPTLSMYRRLLNFVAPYRWNVIFSAVLLVISTVLGLYWPQVVQRVVDGLKDPGLLDVLVAGLVVVLLVRAVVDGVRQYVMAYTGERVIFDLRMAIVRHLQSMSLSFFNARKTGDLMSHVTSDATVVHGVITQTILQVLGQVLTLVGGLVVIFLMNWKLALLTLVVAPPIGLLGQRLGRQIRDLSRVTQEAQGEAVGVLQEAIAEVRVVQAFTREEYEAERFHTKLLYTFAKTMERNKITSIMFPLIGFLGFASSIVVLWFGGHEVANGELTTGQLVAFLLYLGMVAGPIGGLAGQWGGIQSAFGAADRIFALLDTLPDVQDAGDAVVLPPVEGEIVFENVGFKYGDGPAVLDGVTSIFKPGETTALVGPSGAGKTTLVNLVGRFYDPIAGTIAVDGHDLRSVTLRSLRSQIAVVPQEPILFADTIRENIRYGRLDASVTDLESAAEAANATEFIARLPKGMARALLRDAPILLLDEATSSLDNESEFLVQQALDRLMRGRTTIVIAHRLSTVERAHRILVLDRGRIVEEGTHQELLLLGGLYHRLYTRKFVDESTISAMPRPEMAVPASARIMRMRDVGGGRGPA